MDRYLPGQVVAMTGDGVTMRQATTITFAAIVACQIALFPVVVWGIDELARWIGRRRRGVSTVPAVEDFVPCPKPLPSKRIEA